MGRYLSPSELNKVKELEIEILLELKRVCTLLDIEFYLDAGTLLGAIRHGGFIPWDDDIDVSMMREDYERLVSDGPRLLSDRFFLQTPYNTPNMPASFLKLRLNGTKMIESVSSDVSGNHGLWIDIFPFDVVPADVNIKQLRRTQAVLGKVYDLKARGQSSEKLSKLGAAGRCVLHTMLKVIPRNCILKQMRGNAMEKAPENAYITCFHYGSCFFLLDYSESFPAVQVSFEGYKMLALRTWRDYLEQVYGDWQKLPPKEQRRPHHEIIDLDLGVYGR